ncbi:hypothetical protein [Pseudodesulfovibrio indicus]|uniref:hypothetical protein n=1 Tax=Pseudodesulfovibrio indicus TaxID=1716143 RepID=UPI0010631C1F|nr:hypothetical protein [Pseudodesulfovibrio indicus]
MREERREIGAAGADGDRETECVLTAELDFDEIRDFRAGWGFYRDRRPQYYGPLMTLGGVNPVR